ncbi:hypothetical protein DUNSADRAFT_633 [Dunaliella salina]|uniref:Uncharacterized protein n=1 Tax=Dunaliella salina TaxID=3046 RepID=A0ABQ7FYM2_DUNSA|nr:hypothetical protein DUNSADRAFT_633 [Dunaliella salina]|eukprot:KAF5827448.1 hypothetical protein DUNSADRAFT_633 [Dunaliella salina]
MTQQQQAQRQRQLAQQQYTLWQQEQEREGLRLARRGQQQQGQTQEKLQEEQNGEEGVHEQQQQHRQQGVNASKLQPSTSTKSFQERQERLQAARGRKQSRDDKLRQGILLHNSNTPPNLPLLSKQLQSPPRSPPVKQIEVLDSLRKNPRKAQPTPKD